VHLLSFELHFMHISQQSARVHCLRRLSSSLFFHLHSLMPIGVSKGQRILYFWRLLRSSPLCCLCRKPMHAMQLSFPNGCFIHLQPNGNWVRSRQRSNRNSSALSLPYRNPDGDADCLPAQAQLSQNVLPPLHLFHCRMLRVSLPGTLDPPFSVLEFGPATTTFLCECGICNSFDWFYLCNS